MTRLHTLTTFFRPTIRRMTVGSLVAVAVVSTGCTTNYLTNSTQGTYGVPVTERTIPQRLLDGSIEHTIKVNAYGLQENLKETSRISIDSFYSEVLLTGEVPSEAIKKEIGDMVASMPDVRRVYNELNVGVARGYSATVHDGYITSKLMAKVAANDAIKASQIKAVTDDGVVYVMGRMTPTQQSNLVDIANNTVGITELVLLTTLINDNGAPIDDKDIMYENGDSAEGSNLSSRAMPLIKGSSVYNQPMLADAATVPSDSEETSGYIQLYQQ
ncbi:BON domain-containing protein [Psychrobacter aestuarii]|uniref:BON domain-containing protein n=1 Tax=Psychrobacter aestuarii TaxID=556327 RepID=A0ABN0VSS0_9GAMM|nr:BON domain-containing protein [Psychrobacter aestuarii]